MRHAPNEKQTTARCLHASGKQTRIPAAPFLATAIAARYQIKRLAANSRDLDVPGYTCEGGVQVEVLIEVNPSGRVVSASLMSGDEESCFGLAALRSARRARFNASSKAPAKQKGRLTYLFVAQ